MSYTIKEISKLTGLPASTLRYYENVGIIKPVARDGSSNHRKYSDSDLEQIYTISCLYAASMPMKSIKEYFENIDHGESGIDGQIELFSNHIDRLQQEIKLMKVRQKYVQAKLDYWKAVKSKDQAEIDKVLVELKQMATKLIEHNK